MNIDVNGTLGIVRNTASMMYAAMPVKIVLIIIGLLFCFAGFKLLRWIAALFGAAVGVLAAACATYMLGGSVSQIVYLLVTIAAMLVLGLLLGALCFRFYKLGVFLMCAAVGVAIGYVPSLFVQEYSMTIFFAVLAVYGILFGVTGLLFLKPAAIILTSCCGFVAAFPALAIVGGQPMWMSVAAGAILTIIGMIVQFATNRRVSALPQRKKKHRRKHGKRADTYEDDDEAYDADSYEDTYEDDDEIVPSAVGATEYLDSTRVMDGDADTPVDDIDAISHSVAQRLDPTHTQTFVSTGAAVTGGESEPTRVISTDQAQSDDPEVADDSTMYISMDEAARTTALGGTARTEALKTEVLGTEALGTQALRPDEGTQAVSEPEDDDDTVYEDEDTVPDKKRPNPLRILFPLVMLAVAVGFAAFGIVYAEAALALMFLCYALRFYKLTALTGLILCARSGLDAYYLMVAEGISRGVLGQGLSCVIYLVLVIVAIAAALKARREAKNK